MIAITSASRTLLGLADIAALADVQRPVVSMWRARSARGTRPFPQPAAVRDGRERFALDDVVAWLEDTGHGNNRHVRADGALHAALDLELPHETVLDGVGALLTLKAMTGSELAGRSTVDLLDEADDVDPDDEYLYRELDALGEDLSDVAAHADAMASAAYHATAALERVIAVSASRTAGTHNARTVLDPAMHDVVARIAAELMTAPDTVVVDPSGSAVGLVPLRLVTEETALPTAALPRGDAAALRRTRRRLRAHGWHLTHASADGGRLALPRGAVVVAQYPSPDSPRTTDEAILGAIDEVALAMDDSHTAVVVGPSSALIDRPATPETRRARDAVLRTHRVRAAVRLPAGLRTAHPRERLALWVLGPAHAEVPIAERWMALADVTVPLSGPVVEDLVTDMVAAVGPAAVVRAHALRFARLARTSRVVASAHGLVDDVPPRAPVDRAAGPGQVAAVERLRAEVREPVPGHQLDVAVTPRVGQPARVVTLGQLGSDGAVRMISGNRVDTADLLPQGDVRAIGPDQLHGGTPMFVDRLTFSSRYPAGRYTEPGDIVLTTTTGRPAAMVDDVGVAVVVSPARVLRLVPGTVPGLVPAFVVRAIRNAPEGAPWTSWPIPLVPPETVPELERELAEIAAARQAVAARLAALDELTETLSAGVIAGTLALTPPEKG